MQAPNQISQTTRHTVVKQKKTPITTAINDDPISQVSVSRHGGCVLVVHGNGRSEPQNRQSPPPSRGPPPNHKATGFSGRLLPLKQRHQRWKCYLDTLSRGHPGTWTAGTHPGTRAVRRPASRRTEQQGLSGNIKKQASWSLFFLSLALHQTQNRAPSPSLSIRGFWPFAPQVHSHDASWPPVSKTTPTATTATATA